MAVVQKVPFTLGSGTEVNPSIPESVDPGQAMIVPSWRNEGLSFPEHGFLGFEFQDGSTLAIHRHSDGGGSTDAHGFAYVVDLAGRATVQHVTHTIPSGSGTPTTSVPIQQVSADKSFILATHTQDGQGSEPDEYGFRAHFPWGESDPDEVVLEGAEPDGTQVVYLQVVTFTDDTLVQQVGVDIGDGTTSQSETLESSVDTSRTFIVTNGYRTAWGAQAWDRFAYRGRLTDSSTVLAERENPVATINLIFFVVELPSGNTVQPILDDPGGTDPAAYTVNPSVDASRSFPLLAGNWNVGSTLDDGGVSGTLSVRAMMWRSDLESNSLDLDREVGGNSRLNAQVVELAETEDEEEGPEVRLIVDENDVQGITLPITGLRYAIFKEPLPENWGAPEVTGDDGEIDENREFVISLPGTFTNGEIVYVYATDGDGTPHAEAFHLGQPAEVEGGSGATATIASHELWLTSDQIAQLPSSGDDWDGGTGEVKTTADDTWPSPIDLHDQDSDATLYCLAGALTYAKLASDGDPNADTYRTKVADYLDDLVNEGLNTSTTALSWARNTGSFVIAADLISLGEFRPLEDSAFRGFIDDVLTTTNTGDGMDSVLDGVNRPNNIGAWCLWSSLLGAAYREDQSLVDDLVDHARFWLGDRTALASDPFRWHDNQTWQEDPNDSSTWRPIVRQGVVRDGHDFDGILPEDQRRGTPNEYDPNDFPNEYDNRYIEGHLGPIMGILVVLQHLGHTDAHLWSDSAVDRALTRFEFFVDNHSNKQYTFFTQSHEAGRPIANYLYGLGSYPLSRQRSQLGGGNHGYGFTHYSHGSLLETDPGDSPSFEESITEGDDGVDSITTSETISGGTDQLYLCQVSIRNFEDVDSVSGGGLTWEFVGVKESDRGIVRVELWKAFGSPGSSFDVTVDLTGALFPDEGVAVTVCRYSGASGTLTSVTTEGTGGADDDNPVVTTTATQEDSTHYVALCPRHLSVDTHDPDYPERAWVDGGAGGNRVGAYAADHPVEDTGDSTFDVTLSGDADWAIVAAVIEPAGGS